MKSIRPWTSPGCSFFITTLPVSVVLSFSTSLCVRAVTSAVMALNWLEALSMRASNSALESAARAARLARSRNTAKAREVIFIETDSSSVQRLLRGERHVALDLLFGIDDWLQSNNVIFFSSARLQQGSGSCSPRRVRNSPELFRIHPDPTAAA